MSNQPANPITAPSTILSKPPALAEPAPPRLSEMPRPLAMNSPGSRDVVELLSDVLELDGD